MYIQADGSLAAGMLYLRGGPEHRDDHWMMVDKGTGLPVWIDSTLRSARDSLGKMCIRDSSPAQLLLVDRMTSDLIKLLQMKESGDE